MAALPDWAVRTICVLEGHGVIQYDDNRVAAMADADIDADGAYRAYHPDDMSGLDALSNAGHPGNWWGLVTNLRGEPIIQGPNDPAPGFYVSSTAYQWPQFARTDPRRYLDSETVRFIVVENFIRQRAKGVVLGCRARVTYRGKSTDAVVGDLGPLYKFGELSIACAKEVGIPPNARTGGADGGVLYEFWPGTPAKLDDITYPLIPFRPSINN